MSSCNVVALSDGGGVGEHSPNGNRAWWIFPRGLSLSDSRERDTERAHSSICANLTSANNTSNTPPATTSNMFKKQLMTIAPYTASTVNCQPQPKDRKSDATKAPSPVSKDRKSATTTTTATDSKTKR